MTENSALPSDWIGKRVELTIVGAQQDTRSTTRLVAVDSDGIRVEERDVMRFIPWHAVRQVRRAI